MQVSFFHTMWESEVDLRKVVTADLKAVSTVTLLALLYDYEPTSDRPGVEVERHAGCQPQRSGGAVVTYQSISGRIG